MVKVERGDIFYCVMKAAKEKVTSKLFENHVWFLVYSGKGFVLGFVYMTAWCKS